MNCSVCNQPHPDSEMLQTNTDEFFCKSCFKTRYYSTVDSSDGKSSTTSAKGDSLIEPIKMFPPEELALIQKERELKSNSIYSYSKRPLQCPHVDCNRYVRCPDLSAHFIHEHLDVAVIQAVVDTRIPMPFVPADIRYGSKQCLALLQPPLPVAMLLLASRIAGAELVDADDFDEDERVENHDKIIVWVASNISSAHTYTAAVSTLNEDVRVKFCGPILQLGNTPIDLCREGQCLILSHFHIAGMTQNGAKPLQLDVIIHADD